MMKQSTYIPYLDFARCLAVVSVVSFHCAEALGMSIWVSFFHTYFLSLFFCISGILTNPKLDLQWLEQKALRCLVPFVSFLVVWFPYHAWLTNVPVLQDARDNLLSDSKGGAWFILTLFMFYACAYVAKRIQTRYKFGEFAYYLLLFLPWPVITGLMLISPMELNYALSLASFRRYYLIFLLGIFMQRPTIMEKVSTFSWYSFIPLAVYIFAAWYYVFYVGDLQRNIDFFIWLFVNVVGCCAILNLFAGLQTKIPVPAVVKSVSTNSLGIYLTQFFFIPFVSIFHGERHLLLGMSILIILLISWGVSALLMRNVVTAQLFLGVRKK